MASTGIAPSSELLAARAADGDTTALSSLYEHWSDKVYRWVLVKTNGMHHPAEDICQDVWLRVARGIRTFTVDKGAGFAQWLFTIARTCVIDAFRRAGRRPEVPTADMLTAPSVVVDGPDADETGLSSEVAEALAKLNGRRARVITLRYFVGLSIEETADALDMTPGAVRSAQCRALKDLRKHLGNVVAMDPETTLIDEPLKTRAARDKDGASR